MLSMVVLNALLVFLGRLQLHLCYIHMYPSLLTYTHASWVNQPIYAIGLKTVWYKEPLLVMFSKVVLSALYGVLGRFQQHLCPITPTVHILMRPGRIKPTMQ